MKSLNLMKCLYNIQNSNECFGCLLDGESESHSVSDVKDECNTSDQDLLSTSSSCVLDVSQNDSNSNSFEDE